ncbi:hypothetical protein DLM85_09315 [Hymenobacter edaphi]|uniref:Secretion system C-terminal sorting domain-containing protein n=1 Tax=Hymenobacter edaphi TaxID=2211146 RepID=A0A328BLH3_9BACT|nr:hypothetical protein DLM85_09315 [Hymenobacter edaphi]
MVSCRVGTPTTACRSNDPRDFGATLVRGQIIGGEPYCASLGNTCGAIAGRFNYETAKYEAVVTLPPAPSWTLSVTENARPTLANVAPNTLGDLYLEATLNNQLTLAGGTTQTITNTSPQYSEQNAPVPFACPQQRSSLSFSATEPDGDSLVYSLDRALEGCNQPMRYTPSLGGAVIIVSTTPPCVAVLPTSTSSFFLPTFPLPSFTFTGTCPVRVAIPSFYLNANTGSATFTPYFYDANVPANNRYLVIGKVTEYRRLNGRYYLVGSVRRDMMVVVTDCGGNQAPNPPGTSAGTAGPVTDSLVVESPVLTTTSADFHFTDPNPGDRLTLTATHNIDLDTYLSLYASGNTTVPLTIVGNGTAAPVLQVRLRPAATLLGRTFRISLRVEDNGCPVKIVQHNMLVIRVVPARTAAAHAEQLRAGLSVFPNPFNEQVRFSLPRPQQAGAQVLITDQLGRVVERLPVPAGPGAEATLTWTPRPGLPAGVYLARPASGGPAMRLLRR